MLIGTAGSTGSLSNRLNVSLEDDGTLSADAIDAALHNIAYHTDGEKDGIEYVRMKASERAKLSLIQSEANFITIEVGEDGTITNGNVEFRNSNTIEFNLDAPNIVRAHSKFPSDSVHRHVYGRAAAHQNPSSPNWRSFKTTSIGTPYIEGSLRVYVNGVRIGYGTYAPIFSGSSTPSSWMLFSVSSQNHRTGEFVLNSSVPQPGNNVMIDFDPLTSIPEESSSSTSARSGSSSSSLILIW
jgi:hypothetical protein